MALSFECASGLRRAFPAYRFNAGHPLHDRELNFWIALNDRKVIFKRRQTKIPYPTFNLSFDPSPFEPPPLNIGEGGSFLDELLKIHGSFRNLITFFSP